MTNKEKKAMTRQEEIKQEAYRRYCNDPSVTFNIQCLCFESGAKWADKTMIEKACEFIAEWFYEHPHTTKMVCSDEFENIDYLINRLKKVMEGGEK